MRNVQKVVSKYLRLRMTDELREMIKKIPEVESLEETQAGNHIYLGNGKIRTRSGRSWVRVRVWMKGEEIWASVRSRAGLSVAAPFRTVKERREFTKKIMEGIEKCRS